MNTFVPAPKIETLHWVTFSGLFLLCHYFRSILTVEGMKAFWSFPFGCKTVKYHLLQQIEAVWHHPLLQEGQVSVPEKLGCYFNIPIITIHNFVHHVNVYLIKTNCFPSWQTQLGLMCVSGTPLGSVWVNLGYGLWYLGQMWPTCWDAVNGGQRKLQMWAMFGSSILCNQSERSRTQRSVTLA